MSGDIAAAGDIATGALIARAVEPEAGEHGGDAHGHGVCLNCGTTLIGEFCHVCGQNGHVHKSLAAIGHDLLHGVFHFEGKIWRTLPMLLTHPGELTRRYIDGERAKFVSPMALFLFFVFLMFATIHAVERSEGEGGHNVINVAGMSPAQRAGSIKQIDAKIAAAKTQRTDLTARIAAARQAGRDSEAIEDQRDKLDTEIEQMDTVRDTIVGFDEKPGEKGEVNVHKTGWKVLDKGIAKVQDNPELVFYKLQTSAYKYSWALIPISAPFVALLFLWRRRFKLYDHAIFVTYSIAFMMLGTTVVTVLMMVGAPGWTWGCLIAFGPPVHMFYQLRGTYGLNWFSALWRTVALLMFSGITLILFLLLLLGLGVMG